MLDATLGRQEDGARVLLFLRGEQSWLVGTALEALGFEFVNAGIYASEQPDRWPDVAAVGAALDAWIKANPDAATADMKAQEANEEADLLAQLDWFNPELRRRPMLGKGRILPIREDAGE